MTANVKSQEKQLEKDCTRKQSARYKLQRSASKHTTTDNLQHHYGSNSQQLVSESLITFVQSITAVKQWFAQTILPI